MVDILEQHAGLFRKVFAAGAKEMLRTLKFRDLAAKNREAREAKDKDAQKALKPLFDAARDERRAFYTEVKTLRDETDALGDPEKHKFRGAVRTKAVANGFRGKVGGTIHNLAHQVLWVIMPWDQDTHAFLRQRDEHNLMDLTEISPRILERLISRVAPSVQKMADKIPSLEDLVDGVAEVELPSEEELEAFDYKARDLERLRNLLGRIQTSHNRPRQQNGGEQRGEDEGHRGKGDKKDRGKGRGRRDKDEAQE
ncbi:MAG: hypothetical protein A3C07_01935 [Candidatus Sungbacteria bacterium RIFCSPHIGHO2_02_FULL_47_11]|uniref:Uncharacterized protein n=1 Tax=Candidatus Sungbacteria bacterium RIFCSPHIGHO2_02_FULL_47_11 TaxID=1802270 RepID=A0A1G2KJS5_9BACT|nr:MAG: hypothetical protein A3C07_01935 [Candidatus Sungbacteria bacterium RIFCSPHIGHO2_02_FULL_47_11]